MDQKERMFVLPLWMSFENVVVMCRLWWRGSWGRSGVRFTKQVQQTLSLTLNSELIYSEIGNSEFSVPEQQI